MENMKIQHTIYLLLGFLLSSCGEDRSGEYYALIEDKMWIEETMQKNYLWNKDMPIIEKESEYFTEPATFFKKLLSKEALDGKGDSYSYLEEIETTNEARAISLNRQSTYGMEFELMRDPLQGTTHNMARILYVLPGSPAEAAGIKRGDWLTTIGKNYITTDNAKQLLNGGANSFARDRIVTTEDGNLIWQAVDTVSITPSIQMEISPFLINTVYQVNGQKIAYFVYNEFATGPQNESNETAYMEQMVQIFHQFKKEKPDAFILDLRYNPGGFLSCAQVLGSLLVPAEGLGKDFIKLQFNEQSSPQTINYTFDTQYADANLNLNKIYILTSRYTASASEAIINGLIPYMGKENVIVIGEQTVGKNVAMSSFKDERFNFVIWPVIAYVYNSNDESDYSKGFTPQYILDERGLISPWYPMGDEREYFLRNTISLITTGTMPDLPTDNEDESETQVLMSSLSTRSLPGIRIK